MAPLRGWGPKGKRLRGFVPRGHWRTLTFLGALRHDGLAAPCVFDGPINGACFRAYVEQQLVPILLIGGSLLRLVAGVAPEDQHAILRKRSFLLLRKPFQSFSQLVRHTHSDCG